MWVEFHWGKRGSATIEVPEMPMGLHLHVLDELVYRRRKRAPKAVAAYAEWYKLQWLEVHEKWKRGAYSEYPYNPEANAA